MKMNLYWMTENMTFDYRQESKTPMIVTLADGEQIRGDFIDVRIAPETIPEGKKWYHLRHSDTDGGDIASIRRGCVAVNFFGTFICEPIGSLAELGAEADVVDYLYLE